MRSITGSNFLRLLKTLEDTMTENQWDLFSQRVIKYLTVRRDARIIAQTTREQGYKQAAVNNDLLEVFEEGKIF
jgi:hypothetical protein